VAAVGVVGASAKFRRLGVGTGCWPLPGAICDLQLVTLAEQTEVMPVRTRQTKDRTKKFPVTAEIKVDLVLDATDCNSGALRNGIEVVLKRRLKFMS
jgi:hypothetical protein